MDMEITQEDRLRAVETGLRLLADATGNGPLVALAQRLSMPSVSAGGVTLDRRGFTVTVGKKPATLTGHEFSILWIMVSNHGVAVTRAEIDAQLRVLDGAEPREIDPTVERSIDMHVSKIRKAIGRDRIVSVRGFGYRFGDLEG